MQKNSYHHGNLKEEFLRIAFEFIHKESVDKLTLKVLSDATGTSRSAIYRHFSSKDALMEEIIRKGFSDFDNHTAPILENQDTLLMDRFVDNMFKMLLAGLITKKVKLLSILPFAETILERRL